MGVDNYEPRVLHQLMEYMHSYCVEIFADSSLYAEHAGRPGQLECEDVHLSTRLKAAAAQATAPQLMEWLAKTRNRDPLTVPAVPNVLLPDARLCLVEENYQLAPPRRQQAPTDASNADEDNAVES